LEQVPTDEKPRRISERNIPPRPAAQEEEEKGVESVTNEEETMDTEAHEDQQLTEIKLCGIFGRRPEIVTATHEGLPLGKPCATQLWDIRERDRVSRPEVHPRQVDLASSLGFEMTDGEQKRGRT